MAFLLCSQIMEKAKQTQNGSVSYWLIVWQQYRKNTIGMIALIILLLFVFTGLYAPFFASSKPIVIVYNHHIYFPLFRYLFYTGFYTKKIDIFYNLLMFTLPIALFISWILKYTKKDLIKPFLGLMLFLHLLLYIILAMGLVKNPSDSPELIQKKMEDLQKKGSLKTIPSWDFDLLHFSNYEKINTLLRYRQRKSEDLKYGPCAMEFEKEFGKRMPTLFCTDQKNLHEEIRRLDKQINETKDSAELKKAEARKNYLLQRQKWLEDEQNNIVFEIPAIIRPFHWEDDAGGQQSINKFLPWWEVTRVNRKDLVAALIFGVRISLVVGMTAVAFSLIIGIPIGMISGFFAGTVDIVIFRLIEIWEAMPTFFMLLLIVAITQSKSIFLVVAILGIFGWTGFGRFMRAEVLKQRNLPYVLACKNLGFSTGHIMFSHILPNAIPPILTLLPFSMMAAITSEAGLSFLGLGEASTPSWGVLMDEGRSVFPGESYLIWPPAILLTILLTAIALVGDALRDAIDPKLRR